MGELQKAIRIHDHPLADVDARIKTRSEKIAPGERHPPSDQDRVKGKQISTYSELQDLFEQFFALVEAAVRLPPGLERRAAFREVGNYGARIDTIAAKCVKPDHHEPAVTADRKPR